MRRPLELQWRQPERGLSASSRNGRPTSLLPDPSILHLAVFAPVLQLSSSLVRLSFNPTICASYTLLRHAAGVVIEDDAPTPEELVVDLHLL